jgi:hypothetical protein
MKQILFVFKGLSLKATRRKYLNEGSDHIHPKGQSPYPLGRRRSDPRADMKTVVYSRNFTPAEN